MFYADDIKLNHPDHKKLQDMLNICSKWSKNNKMQFNISKSNYLLKINKNGTDTPLKFYITIDNQDKELKGVLTYTYLGFPHTDSGIHWKSHLNSSTKKSKAILDGLQYYKDLWPEYIKLNIFRIYIRPIMEHAACLAFYWMDPSITDKFKNEKYIMDNTNDYREVQLYYEVTRDALHWIINHRRTTTAACLLGIP